jgi:hypothetical protein
MYDHDICRALKKQARSEGKVCTASQLLLWICYKGSNHERISIHGRSIAAGLLKSKNRNEKLEMYLKKLCKSS